METKITNRSLVGWDYNSSPTDAPNGGYIFEQPTSPCHKGTIKNVTAAIQNDRNFQAHKSGGGGYSSAWFVKVGGKWYRITTPKWQWEMDFEMWKEAVVTIE